MAPRRRILEATVGSALALALRPLRAQRPESILEYILRNWALLTRSPGNIAAAAVDPKLPAPPDGRWPVYVARAEDLQRVKDQLRNQMRDSEFRRIDIRALPPDIADLNEHGLLYLPKSYVVPGGRFNEMYGWDSYFIQTGLLRDGLLGLAQDMADNALYQVRQYGKILNANRTYYLTRSQPPFLTEMLLGVFDRTQDRKWLEDSLPAIDRYYRFWTQEPHLTQETGLSRYFGSGDGPAPEVAFSERDKRGRDVYELIKEYFRKHRVDDYDVSQYYNSKQDTLTPLFYKGDRSVRESGFDPSGRFGPFSIDIIHYNPVCLNSLLYQMETQAAKIFGILHRDDAASVWKERAASRASRVNHLMWDAHDGFYYDYDFVRRRLRRYPFLTTFYPLWAGFATPDQAARLVKNLEAFECPGGLQTSTRQTGDQWDAPFGWAPLQWIAVQGLRRYGYQSQAIRISKRFLALVQREFSRHGVIEEKYDVVHQTADVDSRLRYGYRSNEAGFGWTNAVFTALFDQLSPDDRREVLGAR